MFCNSTIIATGEVQSLLEEAGEESEIRDIKGPFSLQGWTYFYIIFAILAAITVIVLVALLLRRRKKKEEIPTPLQPAHEIAYIALRDLMKKDYLRAGKIKEYYFELSNIIRRYIENRFQLRAPEMTTEEFLFTIRDSEILSFEQKGLMREFLLHCDIVKFANYHPDEKEVELIYELAKRFVDQTKEAVKERGSELSAFS